MSVCSSRQYSEEGSSPQLIRKNKCILFLSLLTANANQTVFKNIPKLVKTSAMLLLKYWSLHNVIVLLKNSILEVTLFLNDSDKHPPQGNATLVPLYLECRGFLHWNHQWLQHLPLPGPPISPLMLVLDLRN